jgi:hypothetical protein
MASRSMWRIVSLAAATGVVLGGLRLWQSGPDTRASSYPAKPVAPRQGSATPTSNLAELTVDWRWDHWFEGCIARSQPWILTLGVFNAGTRAAGPFVVHDQQVQWEIPGLAPSGQYYLREWGRYPKFPLVVDAYGQVPEADEGNNVVMPPVDPPWTRTPTAAERRETPRPPGRHGPKMEPMPLRTLPVFCTPRPPAPTRTPSGPPRLPDLEVAAASWDRLVIQHPESGPCFPSDQPWRFVLTIRNRGDASAGWFSVVGGSAEWKVHGLGPGAVVTLASEPRLLPSSVHVDLINEVEESREDNNSWSPPADGTPTPAGTAPAFCAPTPTSSTPTWTSRPPTVARPTRTRTPLPPSPTPSPPPVLLPALQRGAQSAGAMLGSVSW